jgi:hypothetical protein
MQQSSSTPRGRKVLGLTAAAILIVFGVAAVVQGLNGRATVRDALVAEAVVGTPDMTPSAIAAKAKGAGLQNVELPTCSVAGKSVASGAEARCFAQYMRVDALVSTQGKTYAEMPRFATQDGKGTNIEAEALVVEGRPMNNPARNVWVTATTLMTALNTSYMAEQVALFGIAVGAMFLLVGLAIAAASLGSIRLPKLATARRRTAHEGAMS